MFIMYKDDEDRVALLNADKVVKFKINEYDDTSYGIAAIMECLDEYDDDNIILAYFSTYKEAEQKMERLFCSLSCNSAFSFYEKER